MAYDWKTNTYTVDNPVATAVPAYDALTQQILGQGTTSKWSGEGWGSAAANAADMAKILSGIGITDIKQFGEVPKYQQLQSGGYKLGNDAVYQGEDGTWLQRTPTGLYTDEGYPDYQTKTLSEAQVKDIKPVYGQFIDDAEWGRSFVPTNQSDVVMVNGVPSIKTGTTYGNKTTGQAVPNTYSERQTGNAWGGTFAGSGNTGYRVQFDAQGNPYFYTTGASSNDLANLLGDNPILNVAANVGAAAFGGPLGTAALQALQGKDIGDIAKAAALSYAGGQVGNAVTSGLTDSLGSTASSVLGNVAKQEIASGGKADPLQTLISGGVGAGTSAALGNIDAFNNLSPAAQSALSKIASSAIMNGGNLTSGALTSAANSFLSNNATGVNGPQASAFDAGSMGNYGNFDADTSGYLGTLAQISNAQQPESTQPQTLESNMGGYYDEITGEWVPDELGGLQGPLTNETSGTANMSDWTVDPATGQWKNTSTGEIYQSDPWNPNAPAVPGSSVLKSAGATSTSVLDKIKTLLGQKSTATAGLTALPAFIGALSALKGLTGGGSGTSSSVPSLPKPQQDTRSLPQWDWNKINAQASQQGLNPSQYVARNMNQAMTGELNQAPVQKARGGVLNRLATGNGSGRDDTIDARLSDGEYVMDAETVSLLGDGSTKDGARRLDEMRAKIRQHKGKSMARGKFSANAKSPLAYLKDAA